MSDTPPNHVSGLRRRLVLGAMLIVSGVLLWRGLDITIQRHEALQREARLAHLRVVEEPAHRGMIMDRNGRPLAVSTQVSSVWANPKELAGESARWPELARILGISREHLARLIRRHAAREFIYLRRHVEPARARKVQDLAIAGVHLRDEYRRYYPAGEVAAHVVGFTDIDDRGQEGLERAYDYLLRGTSGSKRLLLDGLRRSVENVETLRRARPGRDLFLSLDRRIQYLAYRELKAAVRHHRARGGSIVVLDPRSGEVLAMANQPAYNPNRTASRVSRRFRNRAVTDLLEPGSTLKPFTVAAALAAGTVTTHTVFDTSPGYLKVGRLRVKDMHDYGRIDVATVLKKSSNVGATRISLGLAPEYLWRTLDGVGFGRSAGSDFPGEAEGVLTDFSRWGEIRRATLSYGYGLSVTPLQLARAYAVLAADGVLRPISFLRVEGEVAGAQVLDPQIARTVVRMLEGVVAPDGTARRAQVAGYRVAGKTGTVRKVIRGGYAKHRYRAVFAGMVPASDPRLVAVVVIDEPRGREYYGGLVAAPVFAKVMSGALRTLGIAPDDRQAVERRIAMREPAPGSLVAVGARVRSP